MNHVILAALRPSCARLPLSTRAARFNAFLDDRFLALPTSIAPPRTNRATDAIPRIFFGQSPIRQTRAFTSSIATQSIKPRKPAAAIPKKSTATKKPTIFSWRKYNDENGMPLPNKALDQLQITSIFGSDVGVDTGNHILRILQYRRLSGSLAEHGLHFDNPELANIDGTQNALDYLRNTYPVDEEAAAGRWAEEEAIRVERQLIERSQSLGFYKKDDTSAETPAPMQGTEYGQRYGLSGLESIRRENERAYEQRMKIEEAKRNEIEQSLGPNETASSPVVAGPTSVNLSQQQPEGKGSFKLPNLQKAREYALLNEAQKPKWWRYYSDQGHVTEHVTAVEMSSFRRLFPSYLVGGIVVALAFAFAAVYDPPLRSSRLWPDIPPSAATCIGLVLMNVLVFVAWRIPPLYRFMNIYFVQVPGFPKAVTAVTSVFSHQEIKHLLTNMVVLGLAGPQLHEQLGRGQFLALYFTSGIAGSLLSLTWFTMTRNLATLTLGASGAVNGVLSACVLIGHIPALDFIRPANERINLPILNVEVATTAVIMWPLLIAIELWSLKRGVVGGIDYMSHFGGYAVGTVAGIAWLKDRQRARMQRGRRDIKAEQL